MSRIGAIKALGALASASAIKGDLWLPYYAWRALRIEAGCDDPGSPPDGFYDNSFVIVSAARGEARLAGDDSV